MPHRPLGSNTAENPETRGLDNTSEIATLDPYLASVLPSWNYTDVLKGLDDFMEMVLNFNRRPQGHCSKMQAAQEQTRTKTFPRPTESA